MLNKRIHPLRNGFTLAELLVVIAIIGIMFAIALPALLNLAGSSKLDGAANAVHAAAKLARQHAIANNQPAYLVLNEGQTGNNLAYRAYAVFSINIHTNAVTQEAGYFLTGWEPLPVGVVFDDQAGDAYNAFSYSPQDDWSGGVSKKNRLKIQGKEYTVLGFKPNGEAGARTHWIYLAEGTLSGGAPLVTGRQGKQIRFDLTGKSKIIDYTYDDGEAQELGD
ncbi:prepilin-type N-terminal cleavage/methylation domain-containing protein [Pontiella sulfatireligans]|uniref:Uncharacterized protein n=1 Tax=Pontiella sulfatireligans TaxID=2750658 RepID=A0A6C2UV97_9BACT|nr:prepilin-type N-terminal cleavage/methylation domain-containing protein [Pontiella sulfatireligans]VGO23037.1 hypothetical protein SCARR_05136 [Pontiella sulfatireligans]